MILRFLGYLFLCVGMVALAYDGMRMLADNGRLVFTPLLQHWETLGPASLTWVRASVEQISPHLWSPVAMTILLLPAWFVAAGAGVLLYVAGYAPPRPALPDGI
jgi:hypothetical protein